MHHSILPCDFALPAEWEPQSAIMLTWPHGGTDWKPYLRQITNTYLQLADIITRYEDLLVVTPILESTQRMLAEKLSEGQMSRVHLYEMDTNDTWARDHGPISMVSRGRHNSHVIPIHLLDFKFNGWGEKFAWKKDNAINLQLYYQGAFNAALENHQGFVLEGGSIESDGRGTLFTTSQCLLAPHRNQPLTRENIDSLLRNFFHVRNVVWLDHGNLVGDDTDGHIDTIVRVAPHDTLLYVGCDDEEEEQYEDFQALEKQLQKLFTYEGYPYRLLKLPMPDAIYDEGDRLTTDKNSKGDRLPATYANFLILNGAVIYPTYNQPEKDEEAKRQIQLAFPDRDVIGVDSLTIIRQHGSIHCLTMQLPEGAIK
ncbi:agmatine deiminase family protein [Segatella copri]|uniref:agmatine deiminase family protein n=1 Tax=Segatella copri TaxID=165179 RepID=UPI00294B48B0|nr:agmatine deiminase family protein [Segatella copri]